MAYQKLQPGRSRPYTISTFSDTVDNVALFDNPILGLTATSGTPGVLTSFTPTTFIQDKVQPGDLVQNATPASRGQSTLVKQVVSDTELILEDADAIFFPNNVFLITPPPSEPAVLNVTQSTTGGISLKITTSGGDDLTFVGLQSGSYLPVQTTRIWETVGDNLVENGSFRSGSNLIQNGSFKEIGPELITNGNFTDISEELIVNGDFTATGSELVVNGDFATDSDWTEINGAKISGGKANIDGDGTSFTSISQASIFTEGKSYKVTADVTITSGLGLKFQDGANNENIGFATTSGSYTFYFVATSNATLVIGRRTGGTAFKSSVDNVSVKQLVDHTVISDDLITNGDFSAASSNLVTNPNFTDTGSEMNVLTSSGSAWSDHYRLEPYTNTVSYLGNNVTELTYFDNPELGYQYFTSAYNLNTATLTIGKSYKIEVTCKVNSGTFSIRTGSDIGAYYTTGFDNTDYETITIYAYCSGNSHNWIKFDDFGTGQILSVNNISVKELGEDWGVQEPSGQSVVFSNNQLHVTYDSTATQGSTGVSQVALDFDTSYKISIDVAEVSGQFKVQVGANSQTINTPGIHTFYKKTIATAGGDTLYLVRLTNAISTEFKINSIIVQELGEDWGVSQAGSVAYNENGATITSINGGAGEYKLYQDDVTTSGKSYKVVYTIYANGITGTNRLRYYDGANYLVADSSVGTHTLYFTRLPPTDRWYWNLTTDAGSPTTDYVTISSTSVEETVSDWSIEMSDGSAQTATKYAEILASGCRIVSDDTATPYVIVQQAALETGKNYKGSVSVTNSDTGEIRVNFGGSNSGSFIDGSNTFYASNTSSSNITFVRNASDVDTTFTHVSAKEVGQGWSVHGSDADHFVEFPGVGARYYSLDANVVLELRQLAIPASGYGKIFKITANCAFTSASAIRVYSGGQDVGLFTEGDNTLYFIAQASASIQFVREVNAPTDVLITNVSVQEVGQDWSVVHSDMEDPDPHAYYVNFPTGYAQFIAATDTPVLQLQQNVLDATSSKSYEINCNIDYGQGPDVVSNGDFSATGTEEVTYPNFTNSDISQWRIAEDAGTPRATMEWNASKFLHLEYDTALGGALNSNSLGQAYDTSYKVTMRVRGTKADGVTAQGSAFGSIGENGQLGQVVSNPTLTADWQDYEFYVVSLAATFRLYLASAAVGDLVDFDSISILPLGEDWTFFAVDATNTISIESGGARVISAGVDISLRQPCLELGKFYKLTCDTTITTGKLGIANTTTGSGNIDLEEGYNEKYFTAASTQLIIKRITGVENVLIDNITVQELDSPQIKIGSGGLTLPKLGQGDNTQTITDSSAANFYFLRGGGGAVDYNAKITDVTVRETGMNWVTYGSQVNFYNGYTELVIDSSNTNVGIYQEDVFQSGVKYRVDVTMKATASFDAEIVESNGASTITSIGTPSLTTEYQDFTYYFTGTGSYDLFIHRLSTASSADETIYIKSASVRQMADDTITVNALF